MRDVLVKAGLSTDIHHVPGGLSDMRAIVPYFAAEMKGGRIEKPSTNSDRRLQPPVSIFQLLLHQRKPPCVLRRLAVNRRLIEQLVGAGDPNWGAHEKLGNGVQGEHLWQLASRYYGDPRLWRLIALANDIADPLRIQAGKLLKKQAKGKKRMKAEGRVDIPHDVFLKMLKK